MKGEWTENELKRNAKWSKSKAKSKLRTVGQRGKNNRLKDGFHRAKLVASVVTSSRT
jgi:hypothetical protein